MIARMTFDVEAIERATVAAVAPRELEELPGWLLAYDSVTVNRARSAVPLTHDRPDAAAVPRIHERYRMRGIAPNFRIAQLAAMAPVERELARLGLASQQPTQVMVARAEDVVHAAGGAVHVAAEPDDAWAAVFLGEGFDPADGASRVATLKRAKGSLFAGVREGGAVVAGGVLALGHGWASIHGMRTALAHRGRGLATRVLAALAREALARDHARIVLQVEVANDTATRVYRRCGFELAWTYAYWRGQ
jgi:predicted GNAT family acetyltransferase